MTLRSSRRNSGSPYLAKISATVMPAAASISWSASANGTSSRAASRLPMEVLPAPIMPTSATVRFSFMPFRIHESAG